MTIAVTGATGFLGRHVLRALVAGGHDAIVVAGRTAPATLPGSMRFVSLDLANANEDAFERLGRPAVLIHLAWGGLPHYRSLHHFEAELPAQYRFLRAMIAAGLPSVVVTGTCFEYGMIDGELAEDRDPRPANPYAFAKATLLRQLQFLQSEHRFALTWARLFYMWGEGQGPASLFPLLQAAAARGDVAFPMSGGEQLRDYLPVETVARLLVMLALRGDDHGVVNISSGEPVAIRSLVERWIATHGWRIVPDLGRFPYPDYEPMAFWGNAAKRRALIG